MIKLPDGITPKKEVLEKLKIYQDEINAEKTFPEQVEKAKASFKNKNQKGLKTFDGVKESLTQMCSGARRCVYCEDSVGDEVEHIYPKNFYPSKCFEWENYIYACGNCNGPKNDKFAIYRSDNNAIEHLKRPSREDKTPPVKPVDGSPLMINPRTQDPFEYCILDLGGTFKFIITAQAGSTDYEMADYTYNTVLRLNEQREFLRLARKNAYGNYKARLYQYNSEKEKGATQAQLNTLIEGIKSECHPTVWKEMQRWHIRNYLNAIDSDLNSYFVACPEALTW